MLRWRGVSALSCFPDESTSLELGHVPRLALFHHTQQCVTIRWTSPGFLCMFYNTSVFERTCNERRFQILLCPIARFWARNLNKVQESQLSCSLRDGASSVPSISAGIISSGGNSVYGFALSCAPESVSALYEAWKSNTLTRTLLRDFSASRLDSFFESRGLARKHGILILLPLASLQVSGISSGSARCPWLFWYVFASCSQRPSLLSLFLQILATLRILAVLRFSRGFLQFCLALQLSTEIEVLSQMARLPSSFLSVTIARVLRTGKVARLPSSLLSLTSPSDIRTFRQSQGRRGLGTVRHAGRHWRAGFDTRYWALECILTVTSEYAIASGPW